MFWHGDLSSSEWQRQLKRWFWAGTSLAWPQFITSTLHLPLKLLPCLDFIRYVARLAFTHLDRTSTHGGSFASFTEAYRNLRNVTVADLQVATCMLPPWYFSSTEEARQDITCTRRLHLLDIGIQNYQFYRHAHKSKVLEMPHCLCIGGC